MYFRVFFPKDLNSNLGLNPRENGSDGFNSLICSSPTANPQNNPAHSATSWMLNKTEKVVGGNAGEGPSPAEFLLLLENLAECSLRFFFSQQPTR